jgi:hypothetical protein
MLWTAIARCGVCRRELNRAEHVPESEKLRIAVSAPLMAVCPERGHNAFSDCNPGVELEWIEEEDRTSRTGSDGAD